MSIFGMVWWIMKAIIAVLIVYSIFHIGLLVLALLLI